MRSKRSVKTSRGCRFDSDYPLKIEPSKIFVYLYIEIGSIMINWQKEKENLEQYIKDNLSYEDIGKKYGCTGANVKKQAKKLGILLSQRRQINPSETFNKGKNRRYCLNCGKELPNWCTKFCSHKCEGEYKNNALIEKWKSGKISGCDVSGNVREFLKRYLLEKNDYKCEKCGFGEVNQFTGLPILEIHHKDGDCFNNKEENLELLCPNCHHLTENFGSRNKNATRTDKRTKYYRDLILRKR